MIRLYKLVLVPFFFVSLTHGMAQTFHQFEKLPLELRVRIMVFADASSKERLKCCSTAYSTAQYLDISTKNIDTFGLNGYPLHNIPLKTRVSLAQDYNKMGRGDSSYQLLEF